VRNEPRVAELRERRINEHGARRNEVRGAKADVIVNRTNEEIRSGAFRDGIEALKRVLNAIFQKFKQSGTAS
jgi:hypothetical protein